MATFATGAVLAIFAAYGMAQTTVTIPASPPAGLRQVSPSFPNVGFELQGFQLYAQTSPSDTSPNQYSINLLNAIFSRTGGHPVLRVGGTTGDGAVFNQSLTQPIHPAPGTDQTGSLQIGPTFWNLTKLLSSTNALFMPQVSYTTNNNNTQKIQDVQSMVNDIGINNIISIEIGNEPNIYGGEYATNASYYSDRFQSIASNVTSGALHISSSAPFFAGPDLASYALGSDDWNITQLFTNSSPAFDASGNVKIATDHWYRSNSPLSIPAVMNHADMVINSKHIATSSSFFLAYNNSAVEYVVDEFNLLNVGQSQANATFSHSLGVALYGVDFMLYCMTLGMKRIHWEQNYGSLQALWQPNPDNANEPAQTLSTYYSLITAAEFIGNTNGTTHVAELTPSGNNDGTTFSSYIAYNGTNTPARIALCNLNYWDESQNVSRPIRNVTLNGIPSGVAEVTVKYLTNPGGAAQDANFTTFGGSQWPYEAYLGAEHSGVQNTTVQLPVSGGAVQVPSAYSEIAIVYL